jgi:hypothetical protein
MDAEAEVVELEPSPVTSVALVPQRPLAGLELWEPEALRAMITREIALREVMVEYMRSQMRKGQHYYTRRDLGRQDDDGPAGGDEKPSLTKEGALNLCHLLHCRPASPEVFETFHPDGHYAVRTRVKLISLRTGEVAGEGEGLCTTLESKYAWRWVPEWKMPEEDREGRVTRKVKIKRGANRGQWLTLYRVANTNLPDLFNTVLKISYKRGLVAGVLTLPLASELFTQDMEDLAGEDEDDDQAGGSEGEAPGTELPRGAGTGQGSNRRQAAPATPGVPTQGAGEPTWTQEQVERMPSTAVNDALAKRLRYLAPDSRDERNGYIRLAFGEAAGSWGDVEPLGLSVRKAGLLKLLGLRKEAPPPLDDDVPSGAETEARPATQSDRLGAPPVGEPPSAGPAPEPPTMTTLRGYASPTSVVSLRIWAKAMGQTDLLEDKLKTCPLEGGVPQVTPQQYQRFMTAVQQAAELAPTTFAPETTLGDDVLV